MKKLTIFGILFLVVQQTYYSEAQTLWTYHYTDYGHTRLGPNSNFGWLAINGEVTGQDPSDLKFLFYGGALVQRYGLFGAYTGEDIRFNTGVTGTSFGTTRMIITWNGKIGIGLPESSPPNSRCQINGSSSINPLLVHVDMNTRFMVSKNGGVSIGQHDDNPPQRGLYVCQGTTIGQNIDPPERGLCVYGDIMAGHPTKKGIFNLTTGYISPNKSDFTMEVENSGLLITSSYTHDNYTPGIFWNSFNNNQTKPKAGIFLQESSQGTKIYLGTSNSFSTGITSQVVIDENGNVGIGTTGPDCELEVKGEIRAEEIEVVENVPASDYVFQEDYYLRSLEEVEKYIQDNKHLPDVPSASEFKENGYKVGDMDGLLLKKIEELTLYVIELKKEIEKLKEQNTK